jgi:hypothetical protein
LLLQEIVQLELFAKQLYETTNPAARIEVEKTLVQFAASPECLNRCQLLLERATVRISDSNHYCFLHSNSRITDFTGYPYIGISFPDQLYSISDSQKIFLFHLETGQLFAKVCALGQKTLTELSHLWF